MSSLRRAAALVVLLALPAVAPAHAQLDPAHRMMSGFVIVPSPVFPSYAPSPAYRPPSYPAEPAYPAGVPRYLPPGGGMAGSTFNPSN